MRLLCWVPGLVHEVLSGFFSGARFFFILSSVPPLLGVDTPHSGPLSIHSQWCLCRSRLAKLLRKNRWS